MQRLVASTGFQVTRRVNTLRWMRQEVLKTLETTVVLDVGANTGQWAGETLGDGFSGKVFSFEPCLEAYTLLTRNARGGSHTCLHMGLGAEDGRAHFFVTKGTVNSSFLKPMKRTVELNRSSAVADEREVEVRRLDGVIKDLGIADEHLYLKIDTQGFEREVLRGAGDTLLRTDAVEVELSLVELYNEQALLPDVWGVLTEAGFRPAWVERGFRCPGDIWLMQLDGLFVRENAWRNTRRHGCRSAEDSR